MGSAQSELPTVIKRHMNYIKHYRNLCLSRQALNRTKSSSEYYENHHIQPKSLGGSNENSNLVLLTPKEHYIAHLLLYKHYKQFGGKALKKMAFALVSMAANDGTNLKREKITSARTYATIREAACLAVLGRKVEDTTNYQKPKTPEHREAIRKARLNAPSRNEKTRAKMRKSALARDCNFTGNYIKSTCPHCMKNGQKNAMLRWHFDNCKERKEVNHAQLA